MKLESPACAVSGMENLVADAPRHGKADSPASQSRHLHCVRLWLTSRQASALFPPRTITDSPALHPFHPALRDSDGRKLARQSKASCAPCSETKTGRQAARLRPASKAQAALTVSTASFRSRNCPSSLGRPSWSDTSPPDFALDWLIAPMHPSRRRPGAPFCRRRVTIVGHALPRLARETRRPRQR